MRLKGIERKFKAAAIRMLARVVPTPRPGERPDWGARPQRVLYLRYDRIGDMVLATGIIEAIVTAQPTVTVDVLASPANATVLGGNPHVRRVLIFDKRRPWTYLRTIARVRRSRYDAVLDAMVMSPSLTTVLLMAASGARHRIGVGGRGNDFALTVPVPRVRHAAHYVDHSAALLAAFGVDPRPSTEPAASALTAITAGAAAAAVAAAAAGLDAPVGGWGIWRPRLYLTDAELASGEAQWRAAAPGGAAATPAVSTAAPNARLRLVVNVSAGDSARYWPEDRFVETLTRLRERYPELAMLVIGSPHDAERVKRIASAAADASGASDVGDAGGVSGAGSARARDGGGGGVRAAETPSVRDMLALVAASDIVFTADTSLTHVASAFGRPAVIMFARGRGALYGPYGTEGCVISTPGPTLQSLAVTPVLATLEAILSDARHNNQPPPAAARLS